MTRLGKLLRWAVALIIFAGSSYPIRLLARRMSTTSLSRSPLASLINFPISHIFHPKPHHVHSPLPSTLSYAYANVSAPSSSELPYPAGTLGIASRIYVVSLPRRIDRRARMEALFNVMDLNLTWWDATSSQDAVVGKIMERVRWERAMHVIYTHWGLLPQPLVAQAVDGELGIPVQSQHGFKTVSQVEAEDLIYWDDDALANPYVYPPLRLHDHLAHYMPHATGNDSFHVSSPIRNEEQAPRVNETSPRPLELSGSELWTLDPLRDARSTQFTNPIPPPPVPDLRLPLPCAPLRLAFDMPFMEDPPPQQDDINDDGTDFSNSQGLSHEDIIREAATEGNEDDLEDVAHVTRQLVTPKSPYPFHLTLSRAMIACWNSHFRLLRHIADGPDEVVTVLEDDVDMEYDLPKILSRLGGATPAHWDIVFLGHCWSREDLFPPLPLTMAPNIMDPGDNNHEKGRTFPFRLHPSFAPKCTHAYVVSRSGAARLVSHLRSSFRESFAHSSSTENGTQFTAEPSSGSQDSNPKDQKASAQRSSIRGLSFAYGRALDQAFVRLIQGRRISAFSIVPSVVVQTKESPSDITPGGNGSAWRDVLRDSALTRLRAKGIVVH